MIIKPSSGKQEQFLSSSADIVLYGGAAGGGKSFGLLLESLRHIDNPKFTCLLLRRNMTDIKKSGALWDESAQLYPLAGATSNKQEMTWKFPSGAKIQFGHLENENTIYTFQGSQICFLGFDELTHFSGNMFWYMLSRNRSSCGVKPYVRATCNPDKDSWVRKFIDWWIDPNTGYAIEERSGVIKYFIRHDNKTIWADTKDELVQYGIANNIASIKKDKEKVIKSFTFIPASLADNRILSENDPGYMANLEAQNKIEKERLLFGNWNISYSDYGVVLSRSDFSRYNLAEKMSIPGYFVDSYFVLDGASRTSEANDYSVLGFWAKGRNDQQYYIIDWVRIRLQEPDLEQLIIDKWNYWKAQKVGQNVIFSPRGVNIERGACGIAMMQRLPRKMIPCYELEPDKDKFHRLNDGLGIIKSKWVNVPDNANWVDPFFEECEAFRADMKHVIMDGEIKPHDDQVDNMAYAISSQVCQRVAVEVYKPRDRTLQRRNFIYD